MLCLSGELLLRSSLISPGRNRSFLSVLSYKYLIYSTDCICRNWFSHVLSSSSICDPQEGINFILTIFLNFFLGTEFLFWFIKLNSKNTTLHHHLTFNMKFSFNMFLRHFLGGPGLGGCYSVQKGRCHLSVVAECGLSPTKKPELLSLGLYGLCEAFNPSGFSFLN